MPTQIGLLLFPGVTQLDLTAPFELFSRVPDATVHVVWKSIDLVRADSGLGLLPTTSFVDCPPLEVMFVPGGYGQMAIMNDGEVLEFLRVQARRARLVTSVCTGALLLGAAGLLAGYEATTHWAFMDLLPTFGARPVRQRVVVDRDRVTAGGVTAGIDFGLRVVAELAGERTAKEIQLELEYDPEPPFRGGHPSTAEPEVLSAVQRRFASRLGTAPAVVRP